jgi:hypothetical protein
MAMVHELAFMYSYHRLSVALQRVGIQDLTAGAGALRAYEIRLLLVYDMGDTRYDQEWRLHVPNGL